MIEIDNDLRDRCYKIAKNNGFHDEELSDAHYLMLIIKEISEVVNADMGYNHACVYEFKNTYKTTDFGFRATFESYIKDSVEDKLSDIVIHCLDFAGLKKIDLLFLNDEILSKICPELMTAIDVRNFQNKNLFPFKFKSYTVLMYELTKELILKMDIKDIILRVFLIAKVHDIDLYWHIEQRMKYNELKPYKL